MVNFRNTQFFFLILLFFISCVTISYVEKGKLAGMAYRKGMIEDIEVIIMLRDSIPKGHWDEFFEGLCKSLGKENAQLLLKAASSNYYEKGAFWAGSIKEGTKFTWEIYELLLGQQIQKKEDSLAFIAGFLSRYGKKEGANIIYYANKCKKYYQKGKEIGEKLKDKENLYIAVLIVDSIKEECRAAVKYGIESTASLDSASINLIFGAIESPTFKTGANLGRKLKEEEIEVSHVRSYMADHIPLMSEVERLAFQSGFIKGYGKGGASMYRAIYLSLGLKVKKQQSR